MEPTSRKPVRWEFLCHDERDRAQWSWRLIAADGSIERTSAPHPQFGQAVAEALQSGFRPTEQHWVLKRRGWTNHYEPDEPPIAIGPRGQVVRLPADTPADSGAGAGTGSRAGAKSSGKSSK